MDGRPMPSVTERYRRLWGQGRTSQIQGIQGQAGSFQGRDKRMGKASGRPWQKIARNKQGEIV